MSNVYVFSNIYGCLYHSLPVGDIKLIVATKCLVVNISVFEMGQLLLCVFSNNFSLKDFSLCINLYKETH